MGQDWRPNKAFSTKLILAYLQAIEIKISDAESLSDLNQWIVIVAYSVITSVISLRGSEGFLLDLGGLCKHALTGSKEQSYFLIPLMGKV
jgi:hypothetical protein